MLDTTLKIVNEPKRPTDWNSINWCKANRVVHNLRRRIFSAKQEGDHKKVRSLQRLMLKSYSNTLLSVRRVTQQNKGSTTAGIDKLVIKTPKARGELVDKLEVYQPWKAKPVKRVFIPKSNNKFRPLGIPTIVDRCMQAKVKNALEPEWESKFEGISYGFRPKRGCHDAIQAIFSLANARGNKKWVIDADIKGAFDNIDHDFLLDLIDKFPAKGLIKQWLKAGYVEKSIGYPTNSGTPQGGVISPLLANIALHGMEQAIGVKRDKRYKLIGGRAIVRYADDFVVFCKTKTDAEEVIQILTEWLKVRGLSFSKEKTKIVHMREGFDFLGFNIKLYTVNNSKTGYRLLIKPSKEAEIKIRNKLREEWNSLRGQSPEIIFIQLNPIIRGWANYYRICSASQCFKRLEKWMFIRQVKYVKRMHPKKPVSWTRKQYWGTIKERKNDNWVFQNKTTGRYLLKFSWFKIERHIQVKGCSSPDDSSLKEYWEKKDKAKVKMLKPLQRSVAKYQNYVCPICRQSLHNNEELHLHHIKPKHLGGKNVMSNLVLLHFYCHQQVHKNKSGWIELYRKRSLA